MAFEGGKKLKQDITNCQNCGAPIIYGKETCEYCGTPYNKIFTEHAKVDIDNEINKVEIYFADVFDKRR